MRNDPHRALAPRAARARRLSLDDARALSAPICQSHHARRRAAQRNLTATDVEYILLWGHLIHRTGAVFYCLRAKDIPPQHRHLPAITRLVGAVVLASRDEEIVTLYRNASRLRGIQRKMKYRFTPGWPVVGADVAEDEAEDEEVGEGEGASE